MMTVTGRQLILSFLLGTLAYAPALAHDEDPSEAQSMSEEIKALRAELAQLREEMKAVRADVGQVLNELKTLRTAQARAQQRAQADTKVYEVEIGDSPAMGPANAPVTIVEFADFQCPFCIREYPTIRQIREEYGDKVRFVFKHYPLPMHVKAKPAHAAAELVRQQVGVEGFWKMHDLIVAKPKNLEVADLRGYAEGLGVDPAKFDAVMADEQKIQELLADDLTEARKCAVSATPTILINGLKLADRSHDGYKARVDEILKGSGK